MRAIQEQMAVDVMKTTVRTVSSQATLADAAEKLRRHQVSALPVLSDHCRCVGILSHTDLEQFEARGEPHSPHHHLCGQDADTTQVSELMTRRVVSVQTVALVSDIARMMSRLGLHHVPVLGEIDQLEGYVSLSDLT